MNPVRLKLKNFRNYKDVEIPFEHKGVMPIVGKNGHGKSTIFHGISLALYGKVVFDNVEAQMKELFLNDGSTEMGVDFDFLQNGNLYRIERVFQYSKSKKGVEKVEQIKLDFSQIIGDKLIPLSSKEKSKTDQKIIDIIGKDCDNFRNSAFFPQGEESRLAKLKPSELIEEISKLKGITIWEELRGKAKKKLDEVNIEIGGADTYVEETKKEIDQKPIIQENIDNLHNSIVSIKEEIAIIENDLSIISTDKSNLSTLMSNIEQLENSLRDIKTEVEEISTDISSIDNNLSNMQSFLNNKTQIEEQYAQLKLSEENKQIQDNLLIQKNQLMQQISVLENQVREAENNTKQKYQDLISKRDQMLSVLQNKDMVSQKYEACRQQIQNFSNIQLQIDNLNQSNNKITIEATQLKSKNDHLLSLINDETAKVHRIMDNGICLECERPIDNNSLESIKYNKAAKIDGYKAEGIANQNRIAILEQQYNANSQNIAYLNEQLKQKANLDRELGQIENMLSNIDKAAKDLAVIDPQIIQLKQIIETGSYSDKFDSLNELKMNFQNIAYSSEQHQLSIQKCQQLKIYESKFSDLKRIETEFPSVLEKRQSLIKRQETKLEKLNDLKSNLEKSDRDALNKRFLELQSNETLKKTALSEKKNSFNNLLQDFGAQQEALERIIKKEKILKDKIDQITVLRRRKFLLERAVDMYSKTGIPTLIIENLLPDIEMEANKLLESMGTDRSISFERAKKADGTFQDKIVIMVRDRRGQKRAFYTYSGAECFQVSFALRVAICGSDDVVFIDEGFGKLDSENLQAIMQTLNALQKKFDKIILITHVQSLIEQFDMKLNITLDSKGYSKAIWGK